VENGAIVTQDSDQNSTDFGKCVDYLREEVFPKYQGATDIVCLGGLGGRVDQGMSTIHHLFKFQSEVEYAASRFYLVSSEAVTFVLMPGKHLIRVKEESNNSKFVLGKHIGIIPVGKAAIISTKGLEWDVKNWHTEIGGQISTSNHVKDPVCEICTTGPVLFTIELKLSSDACEPLMSGGI
jgi:thiamine pyrophosphokinase